MFRRISKKFVPKLFSCLIAAGMLLQLPSQLSARTVTTTAPVNAAAAAPSKTPIRAKLPQVTRSVAAGESAKLDGVVFGDLDTKDVNTFLASDSKRSNFLSAMTSRGVDPTKVKYVSLSDDGSDPNSDLAHMAQTINREAVDRCGGTPVDSVEFWIGAYQHANGAIDGEVLLVANLNTGEQKVLAGFQADEEALNGRKDPIEVDGDFFASSADTKNSFGCPPQSILIIRCWLRCIVIQQVFIYLICFIRYILICVWTGWSLWCFLARVVECRWIIIIRTFVYCWIECFVYILRGSIHAPPDQRGDGRIAGILGTPGEVFRSGLDEWFEGVVGRKASTARRTDFSLARSTI